MTTTSTINDSLKTAIVGVAAVAALGLTAHPALAQQSPPSYATTEESIRGRIVSFDGKYNLQLRDDRGFIDSVSLHDGTVINPTGLRLSTGQSITVLGHNVGKTFAANEIDTPYANYGPAVFYGAPYVYAPYGYYPYGPYAFGVGFRDRGFGFRGWF